MSRADGAKGSLSRKSSIESLWAFLDGADVKGSLGGRCELDLAIRGERWTSEGSSVFPSGALICNEGE